MSRLALLIPSGVFPSPKLSPQAPLHTRPSTPPSLSVHHSTFASLFPHIFSPLCLLISHTASATPLLATCTTYRLNTRVFWPRVEVGQVEVETMNIFLEFLTLFANGMRVLIPSCRATKQISSEGVALVSTCFTDSLNSLERL